MTKRSLLVPPLLDRGRDADVFAWQDGQILKLFLAGKSDAAVSAEVAATKIAGALTIPVPKVFGAGRFDGRPGIIYERIAGPTMTVALMSKRRGLWPVARDFARLHAQVHAAQPDGLGKLRDAIRAKLERLEDISLERREALIRLLGQLPDGDSLCHGDFHPGNVLLSGGDYAVIDWTDASIGDPVADVARTVLLLSLAPVDLAVGRWRRFQILAMRRLFLSFYLLHYRRIRALARFDHWFTVLVAARLTERCQPEERKALLRRLARLERRLLGFPRKR